MLRLRIARSLNRLAYTLVKRTAWILVTRVITRLSPAHGLTIVETVAKVGSEGRFFLGVVATLTAVSLTANDANKRGVSVLS